MLRVAKSRLSFLLVMLAMAFGCKSASTDPTGGETHFLSRCDPSASNCGDRLTCVCGVCTLPCAERASCQGLPAAQCVPTGSECTAVGDAGPPGVCDVSCVSDGDCAVISPFHHCEQGVCRASLSPNGDGGSGGSSDGGASVCESKTVSANQVLVIGDSFFAASHQITAYLEGLAREAGAVSVGERYRDRSSLLANTLALGGNGIADQYASGVDESAVKVVIMNGGGADALLGSCDTANASCTVVANAAAAAQTLLSQMAADQVEQVVYAFYPDPGDADVKARVDALRPLIQSACENASLPCRWLDLRTVFAGHYADYVQNDQLNPTDAGAQASAEAIWATMRRFCIAQ